MCKKHSLMRNNVFSIVPLQKQSSVHFKPIALQLHLCLQPFLQLQCFNKVNAFNASGIVVHNGWYNSVYPHSVIDGSVCILSKDCCQTNQQKLCKIKKLTVWKSFTIFATKLQLRCLIGYGVLNIAV